MMESMFGTDGVRGRVGQEPISPQTVMKLGWAAGSVFAQKGKGDKVLIGKDTRISGYLLESALEAGFSAAGVDISLLGPMPTPGIAYLTRTARACAGVVISASHNPYYDNGIKIFSPEGTKLDDRLVALIDQKMSEPMTCVDSSELGRAERFSEAHGRYIEYCKTTFPANLDLSGIKVVVDCANGAGYEVAPRVFAELGADLKDGDQILYVLANHRHRSGQLSGGVAGTLMTNLGLEQALAQLSIPFVRTKVGDRYVHEALTENNWILGGESSGHIICLDKATTGDGIVAALEVLQVMLEQDQSLSTLVKDMRVFPQTMINVEVDGADARTLVDHPGVRDAVTAAEQELGPAGRVVLRPSGTEPLVRVMIEGNDSSQVERLTGQIADQVVHAKSV
ncbi:MAG: phosphoglucosamine mutase [Gammaproteobacteria bacterium]